jgi:multicomponent Na+:H+ antiporter subunit A
MGWLERGLFIALPAVALGLVVWKLELPLRSSRPWVPALGIDLSFHIDGLSALMLLMITAVGTAVFVYAGGYLAGHPSQRRIYLLLSLFMVALIGCVTADNLIVLFLFWEATSVLSFLLVGSDHERADSRRSARQALLITGSGGLALLAGFILLGQSTGTYALSEIVAALPAASPTPRLTAALVLVLAGAFTKSAQFPFHFWLPNAMAAPTPVSAYLHSATMVKLGVYLLARLDPGFGDWPMWEWALKGAGSITAAWGMILALRERDLKRILAWSTVATLGTLVTLVGLRGDGAPVAVSALLLAHALYKAPLFFVAGNVDHGTGTRIIDRLGNLRHAMPWTASAALLAGASMAGMPLSFGYIVKDAILDAKRAGDVFAFAKAANAVFGAVAVAVAGVAAVRVFWHHPGVNETCEAHEGGPALVLPPLALALAGIALGVFPFFAQDVIAGASRAMTANGEAAAVSLALELGPAMGSLLATLAVGVAIYLVWDSLHAGLERAAKRIGRVGVAAQFERLLQAIPRIAAAATRTVQAGSLPTYMSFAAGSIVVAVAAALAAGWTDLRWPSAGGAPGIGVLGASALIAFGAVAAVVQRDRLVLLLASGVVGYGSGVLFLFTGAPDVAFTQFAVETVFVIVVASALLALERQGRAACLDEPRWRPGALAVAAGFGAAITALLMAATAGGLDAALSRFFAERSVPAANGRNVVNVIIVDFRAMDTLGETTVVLLSLLAALPLLRGGRGAAQDDAPDVGRRAALGSRVVMLEVAARPLYPMMVIASIWVLLRGHNEPGGGFIGGLIAVSASILWAVTHGVDAARHRLPLRTPTRLAATGVLVAAVSGLPALYLGDAYLTHLWATLPLGITELKVSTAMLFDLGVYLCVWGALGGYALALLSLDDSGDAPVGGR